jgi:hypothetical protein
LTIRCTCGAAYETSIEVHEAKLTEEHAQGLHPFDVQDLLAELEELRAYVVGVEDECTTEAGKPSTLVMGISNALINHGMLPI